MEVRNYVTIYITPKVLVTDDEMDTYSSQNVEPTFHVKGTFILAVIASIGEFRLGARIIHEEINDITFDTLCVFVSST